VHNLGATLGGECFYSWGSTKVFRWGSFTNLWSFSLSIRLLHPHNSCPCHLLKPKLANNTCKQKDSCTQGGPFFFFWGRVGLLDLYCFQYVPIKFSMCSHEVPNVFMKFPIYVPQHVPNNSSLYPTSLALSKCYPWNLYNQPNVRILFGTILMLD
jgi:hypothetical protein